MPNRLADALSPYLEQHAHNPVDWYPWSEEALSTARNSDRPILLSIGYSACHWCHVMAHESFEDPSMAERMNAWFVNIKVDREERPDLDRAYQLSHQILTGRSGGWPLTVFLDSSDLTPFAAGTYFPPEPRHGLIGFGELLERVHAAWLNQRDTLREQNRRLGEALTMVSSHEARSRDNAGDPASELLGQLEGRQDRRHGGFGDAPKFPQAPMMEWLAHVARDDEGAAGMLGDALDAMARNGLFDHIGGGFFRYCVDAAWEIPHFEKMLCDNALLLPVFAEAAVRWNNENWAETARRTAAFLGEDMRLSDGGFASSLDADSLPSETQPGVVPEPTEGAFYLWTPAQFEACLGQEAELAKARFGLDGPANFEGRQWHLVIARGIDELTGESGEATRVRERLEMLRDQLSAHRRRRPAPARDDKMLASWNALAAAGLLRAGRVLDEADWIERGCETLDRIHERLFDSDRPRAVWRDGRSAHTALLEDHAAFLVAIMERLAVRWHAAWLQRAESLAERIVEQFFDADTDALYMTPHGYERLPMRPTANLDESTPSGAALTALGLGRLGHLTADAQWLTLAHRIVDAAHGDIERAPAAHASMLLAGHELDQPVTQVLIGGSDEPADRWHAALRRNPGIRAYRLSVDQTELPQSLNAVATCETATAVVCIGSRCLEPARSQSELGKRLSEAGAARGRSQ